MNKFRRANLKTIIESLENLNADLESVRDEEQEAFDNLPDGIQTSERGEGMEEHIYQMDDAMETITSVIDTLAEIAES